MKISKEKFEDLEIDYRFDMLKREELEKLGIKIKPVTMYQFYYDGNFVGDSWHNTLSEIFRKAGIEVEGD